MLTPAPTLTLLLVLRMCLCWRKLGWSGKDGEEGLLATVKHSKTRYISLYVSGALTESINLALRPSLRVCCDHKVRIGAVLEGFTLVTDSLSAAVGWPW